MAELVNGRTPNGESVLLRSVGWGTAAALALGAFAFTAQSEGGNARLQLALAGVVAEKPQALAAVAPEPLTLPPALNALQEKLARLVSDRLSLDARLSAVEEGLQDVTGSVRRQAEAQATASAPKLTYLEPPVIPAINTLPPAPTPVSAPPSQVPAPEAHPPARPTHEAAAAPEPAGIETPAPRAQAPHPSVPAQYGIELAAASDMQSLQARWLEIKANHGPLLAGLSPVAVKDHHKESHQLHLVAGPLMSMVAAQALCTKVAAEKGSCLARKVEAAEVVQR